MNVNSAKLFGSKSHSKGKEPSLPTLAGVREMHRAQKKE
jgi:hypothetical protein